MTKITCYLKRGTYYPANPEKLIHFSFWLKLIKYDLKEDHLRQDNPDLVLKIRMSSTISCTCMCTMHKRICVLFLKESTDVKTFFSKKKWTREREQDQGKPIFWFSSLAKCKLYLFHFHCWLNNSWHSFEVYNQVGVRAHLANQATVGFIIANWLLNRACHISWLGPVFSVSHHHL